MQSVRDCPVCAGIFVDDILDAVPIDKYFELFKPGTGGEGGFIRVAMNYDTNLPENGQGAYLPVACPTCIYICWHCNSFKPAELHKAACSAAARLKRSSAICKLHSIP